MDAISNRDFDAEQIEQYRSLVKRVELLYNQVRPRVSRHQPSAMFPRTVLWEAFGKAARPTEFRQFFSPTPGESQVDYDGDGIVQGWELRKAVQVRGTQWLVVFEPSYSCFAMTFGLRF